MNTLNHKKIFVVGFILALFLTNNSCSSTKLQSYTTDVKLQLGMISEFIKLEEHKNSKEVVRDYIIDMSEEIYPFMKNHIFEIPKEYYYETEQGIKLTTRYYYTKSGNVKLIDYTWSETSEPNNKKFKMLFSKLETKISENLGANSFRNIESEKIKKSDLETYRDDVKWEKSALNAYMYRFGDNENRHNEINLVLYIN